MINIFVKVISILCLILLIYSICFSSFVTASGEDISSAITLFGSEGDGNDGGGMDAITKIIGAILNVTRIVGAAVAIIILMVIAVKYIIASAGDRADIKKYAVNYVIGAVILFSASAILTIIKNFFIDATSSETTE